MKLTLYLFKRFFIIFFGALFFFVFTLVLTDLFINIWKYLSKSVPPAQVGLVMLYYVPKATWYAVPMAMLFATAYLLSDLYAKNELLAIFASGISLFRFTVPLMLLSIAMSVGLFFFEDAVVVATYAKKNALQNSVLEQEKSQDNHNIVVMSEGGKIIYRADFFDSYINRLHNLYVLYRTEAKNFDLLVFAESASWRIDHWELHNPYAYKKTEHGFVVQDVDYDHVFRLMESPETFRRSAISVEEVSVAEARDYIARLEKAGLPVAEPLAEYYKKFAFPFVVFVVVLLAISLSGRTRKNVLLVSFALSITAVVLFYVMQMITMLMASFGTIPAVCGEWVPVIFFVFISLLLLRYTRT